ncbi:MAG: alpha-glucuronidase [Bacteroidales bacterium]|nr:alpha-glucuronidase [Bacteroidales bacterium]
MKKYMFGAALLCAALCASCNSSQPAQETQEAPLRLLNHWDNLNGTVERGYAGRSIFWNCGGVDTARIEKYGAYNQAIGINGTVLNNVNASPKMLTEAYLDTTAIYANLLRPYGLKVWLSINFATPQALGECATADPLDPTVQQWWKDKADQIYARIPDFGGFLVKANSEGEPGPCDFGRTHAEGANMIADALAPHKGQVIWRSFVYSATDADRAKTAYMEFMPIDGQFRDNVIIQIKNGPIDFQPREPISPLFYGLKKTRTMAELQITQEYLGHSNHIVYLAPMWTEFVAEVKRDKATAPIRDFAGVSNIGLGGTNVTDSREASCGNKMAEANWYAFGRLAQDPSLSAEQIAKDWVAETFAQAPAEIKANIVKMMMLSHEACVDYMMPMGLHHQFAWGHHYGPEPWTAIPGARPDWLPSYYHKADAQGLGYDRTVATGSQATAQYPEAIAAELENIETCPEKYLLWFHHVGWQERDLWNRLGAHFQQGINAVRQMQLLWATAEGHVEPAIFADVTARLECQRKDAIWWKDGMLLYFQSFNKLPWPAGVEPAEHKLEDLMKVNLGIDNYTCPSLELLDSKR